MNRPLTQEEIWKLLEGHQDVLTPLAQKEAAVFRNASCPSCGAGGHAEFVNPYRPFSVGSPLPNKLLRCNSCETEWDPHSRIITKASTTDGPG